jgi:hypothetical protein
MKNNKTKPVKFCVISAGRSGSTLLVTLLDSHPDIRLLGEIFNNKGKTVQNVLDPYIEPFCEYQLSNYAKRPWLTFNYLNSLNNYPISVKGLGYKLIDIELFRYPEILLKLILDRYKIIHLVRENALDYYLSWSIVKQKLDGKTELKSNHKITPVYLDTSKMIGVLEGYERRINRTKSLLKLIPNSVLTISYEDLIENKKLMTDSIINFLNIPSDNIELHSDLKKIANGTYSEKIANYQEVKDILISTKFKKFITEQISLK